MNLVIPHGFEANYVIGFARGLSANKVNFTVISDDSIAPRLKSAHIAQCNLRGSQAHTRSAGQKVANLIRYYILLFWKTFQYRGNTLHFNGLLTSRIILFDGLILPVWFRLWAGCYIHTAHNALPHSRENSLLFRWVYRWVYRFPNHIVAHTDKVAQQLTAEFGVAPARISVISIGLNEEMPETALSVREARKELGLPLDNPIAFFFGKVEPYKGVDKLAEAWGAVRTPKAQLIIAGWCPNEEYALKVRHAIANSPQASTMEWREGFVPNEIVATWLKACDVIVMPYRNIYQSGVVFLCLRFGVPIVATNVGSLAEFIDADSGVITRTNDPAGIAEGIDHFFANVHRFDRAAIARAAEKYSWDRQCAAIRHLYL